MDEKSLEALAAIMKVLCDPNRLRIFALLMQGDSCNCELKEKLGLPSNLLSHHLSALRAAGLVNSRRDVIDGRWIYYSVNHRQASRWRSQLAAFLDPARIQTREVLCGPEGKISIESVSVQTETG